jgi:hypothetical protein
VIVVVGVPAWRAAEPVGPDGRACGIALAAAGRSAPVELVGRTGDDAAGDALLLALTRAGVGHVAMLRDPARATLILEPVLADDEAASPVGGDGTGSLDARGPAMLPAQSAPHLESADVSLGLEYLTGYGVLVVTDDVPESVVPVAIEAAAFAGAHLVLLVPPGREVPAVMPVEATVLAAPDEADEGAFATLVGAYAAALDAGISPAAAFAAATGDAGWEPLEV